MGIGCCSSRAVPGADELRAGGKNSGVYGNSENVLLAAPNLAVEIGAAGADDFFAARKLCTDSGRARLRQLDS
jgi:hypothetical protein